MNHQQDNDSVKARFTQWLETLVKNARIDYFKKKNKSVEAICISDIPEYSLPSVNDNMIKVHKDSGFDFEEMRLAQAFYQLPLMKQKVLTMLFVDENTPEEIANKLNCSVEYVYTQKSRALKKLRKVLNEGGDEL